MIAPNLDGPHRRKRATPAELAERIAALVLLVAAAIAVALVAELAGW